MKIRVGIVGDGQLGMLLCEAARTLEIETAILTDRANNPAAQRANHAVLGSMADPGAITRLIAQSDVITYEREDVDPVAIATLRAAEEAGEIRCQPSLEIVEIIQDKARQKRWLKTSGLPTLPFELAHGAPGEAAAAASRLGYPLVQKSLRGGFDGRGVQVLRDAAALERAWPGATLYEAHAGAFTEVAVIVARGHDGDVKTFPPVDMTFNPEYSVLETVFAPSALGGDTLQAAIDVATSAIAKLGGVGVFGVELFHTDDGRMLINEISPRVHNAGHYTLEATECSQFEQHLRAVTGMPLAGTDLVAPAVMRNLLCVPGLEAAANDRAAATTTQDGVAIYWYGKAPSRTMRKLGHITVTRPTREEAAAAVAEAYATLLDKSSGAAA